MSRWNLALSGNSRLSLSDSRNQNAEATTIKVIEIQKIFPNSLSIVIPSNPSSAISSGTAKCTVSMIFLRNRCVSVSISGKSVEIKL